MRRQAGVGITGLVVKASLQNMLTPLRCQVHMQNELSRVDAKLLFGCNLQGISGTRREVDRGDVSPGTSTTARRAGINDFSKGSWELM